MAITVQEALGGNASRIAVQAKLLCSPMTATDRY